MQAKMVETGRFPAIPGGPVVYSTIVLIIPIALGTRYFRERAAYKLQQEMAALTRQYAPGSPFAQPTSDPSKQADALPASAAAPRRTWRPTGCPVRPHPCGMTQAGWPPGCPVSSWRHRAASLGLKSH